MTYKIPKQYLDQCDEIEQIRERVAELEGALGELTAMVRGEAPSLLNEDSGGCARLSLAIDELLEQDNE